MRKSIIYILAAGLLIAASSCNKEDEEAPVISVSSPQEEAKYSGGDVIQVRALLEDNEELGEYKLEIHEAGGHTHKRGGDEEFEFEEIIPIEGTSYQIETDVNIPDSAEVGEYHVLIYCTDAAGNEANFAEVDFDIE